VLIYLIVGRLAITREHKTLLIVFVAMSVLLPAYMGFKLWQLHQHAADYPNVTYLQFVITGGIATVVRVAMLIFARLCYLNFGKGLANSVFRRQPNPRDYVLPLCAVL